KLSEARPRAPLPTCRRAAFFEMARAGKAAWHRRSAASDAKRAAAKKSGAFGRHAEDVEMTGRHHVVGAQLLAAQSDMGFGAIDPVIEVGAQVPVEGAALRLGRVPRDFAQEIGAGGI